MTLDRSDSPPTRNPSVRLSHSLSQPRPSTSWPTRHPRWTGAGSTNLSSSSV